VIIGGDLIGWNLALEGDGLRLSALVEIG